MFAFDKIHSIQDKEAKLKKIDELTVIIIILIVIKKLVDLPARKFNRTIML